VFYLFFYQGYSL